MVDLCYADLHPALPEGEEAGLADVRGAEGSAVHVDSPFLLLLLQALLRAVVRL